MSEATTETKNCTGCGRLVSSTHRGMCGNCYRIWQRDNFPPNATCEVCERDYFRRPSADPNGRTCSMECFAVWKRGRDCRNNPTDGGTLLSRTCEWCGQPFTVEKRQVDKGLGKFCSSACNGIRRRNDPARSKYPENAWRQRAGFRKLAARLLREPGARCAICGERRTHGNLVVHHPIPPDGSEELLMARWNLRILCRACHMAVHRWDLAEAAA